MRHRRKPAPPTWWPASPSPSSPPDVFDPLRPGRTAFKRMIPYVVVVMVGSVAVLLFLIVVLIHASGGFGP